VLLFLMTFRGKSGVAGAQIRASNLVVKAQMAIFCVLAGDLGPANGFTIPL
jgi:hypothetical protein